MQSFFNSDGHSSPCKDKTRSARSLAHPVNLDYKPGVRITGNPGDANPEYLVKQLRRNNINHLKYDHTLFKKT